MLFLGISAGNKNMLTMGHKKSITETNQDSHDNIIREEILQDEVGKTVGKFTVIRWCGRF